MNKPKNDNASETRLRSIDLDSIPPHLHDETWNVKETGQYTLHTRQEAHYLEDEKGRHLGSLMVVAHHKGKDIWVAYCQSQRDGEDYGKTPQPHRVRDLQAGKNYAWDQFRRQQRRLVSKRSERPTPIHRLAEG